MATREGYGCEFTEKPPKGVQSECPICLLVLREPYQATCCGKSFCRECIEHVKNSNQPCPTCNQTEKFNVFHNLGLQQSLYDLQVNCTHSSKGCGWSGELRELDNHLNSHPQADKALEGCPFTTVICPLKCGGCERGIPRKDIKSHLKDNVVPLVVRQTYQITALEQESSTLKAKLQEVERSVDQRVAELERKVRELAANNQKLEEEIKGINKQQLVTPSAGLSLSDTGRLSLPKHDACLTGTVKPIGGDFTMTDFKEKRRRDEVWYSPHFYTHPRGYKMCLRVDANGNGSSKGTYVSVFVHILRGEFDDQLKWPITGNFTVQLLNQEEDRGHHTKIAKCTELSAAHAGRVTKGYISLVPLGFHSFISHADLRPCYLMNDCLKLRIKNVVLF